MTSDVLWRDHWPQCPSCNNAISTIKSQSLKTANDITDSDWRVSCLTVQSWSMLRTIRKVSLHTGENIMYRSTKSSENSTLAITAFITSKLNLFWFIIECPNMPKTCNHSIYHFKTKFVFMHHGTSQHAENSTLA